MGLFLGLYLGHILGDFVFQPGRLVIAKREHQSAAVLHSAIVTLCSALVLAGTLRTSWPAIAVAGVLHLGVEQLSIGARRTPTATGLTVFMLDQGLHVLALALIAMFSGIAVPAVIGVWETTLPVLAAVCAVSSAAFGGSILVFEVQTALRQRGDGEAEILRLDLSRFYGMAERGGALAAALLFRLPLLVALAFVPRLAYALVVERRSPSNHLTAAAVGLALAAAGWILVASVMSTTP